jgi:hypothetical protein
MQLQDESDPSFYSAALGCSTTALSLASPPLEVNFAALHMKAAAPGSCQAAPCTREGLVLDSAPCGREDQDLQRR